MYVYVKPPYIMCCLTSCHKVPTGVELSEEANDQCHLVVTNDTPCIGQSYLLVEERGKGEKCNSYLH